MSTVSDMVKSSAAVSEPDLSFSRSDIEKRIGFPAGRFTSAGPILAPLLAVVAGVAIYGGLALVPEHFMSKSLAQRGPIPYAIVFAFLWSVSILFVKHRKLALQRRSLSLKLLPTDDPGFVLTPESVKPVLDNLYRSVDDPQRFLLTRRIHNALANLRNMGRIGDVDEVLGSQADHDEGQVESSYTMVRGFIWAIPVLGFIGTVWGLSEALANFTGVLAAADQMDEIRTALQDVTGGLSTAFETTLHGLVAALIVHMLLISMRRKEEQFLDDCKDYCQKHVVGRLRLIQGQE